MWVYHFVFLFIFKRLNAVHKSRGSNEYVVPIGTFIGELDGGGISYLRRFPMPIFLPQHKSQCRICRMHPVVICNLYCQFHVCSRHPTCPQGSGRDEFALRIGADALENHFSTGGEPCSSKYRNTCNMAQKMIYSMGIEQDLCVNGNGQSSGFLWFDPWGCDRQRHWPGADRRTGSPGWKMILISHMCDRNLFLR